MALLDLQDLSFAYGAADAVHGVSLAIGAGEVVALVGPNGAGKTTLLRLAGGMLQPQRGRVVVDGKDLRSLARREAARLIGGVGVEEAAEFAFSVREVVTLGRHPWRGAFAPLCAEEHAAVDRALEATDLTGLADRSLPSLSSGERQRAALARCLVQDARVHLLDEPTSHLDLGHRLRMLELFRAEAREREKAVVLVLHDLNLASVTADRIVLMIDGQAAHVGTPSEVLTRENVESAFAARVAVLAHPQRDVPLLVPVDDSDAEVEPVS